MALEDEAESAGESISPVTEATEQAEKAVKDTAGRYLRSFGMNPDLAKVEKWIRDRPLPSAAIAAAAGFIIGGGMASRPGVAMLALLGREAAKQAATNMISGMVRSRMR
jgi:ElaB/YqjD/DUF883 family membrane-anchored ribosome-binding protein